MAKGVFDRSRLIEEMRRRPLMWDVEHADRTQANIAKGWKDIAKSLGSDSSECKANWARLRAAYRNEKIRIKRRIEKDKSSGKYDPSKNYIKYKHFEALKFSDVRIKIIQNIEKKSDIEIADDKQETEIQSQGQKCFEEDSILAENEIGVSCSTSPNKTYLDDSGKDEISNKTASTNKHGIDKSHADDSGKDEISNKSASTNKHGSDKSHAKQYDEKSFNKCPKRKRGRICKLPGGYLRNYRFLDRVLSEMKLLSKLQNLQFRSKMCHLMNNILLSSFPTNALAICNRIAPEKGLVDVNDPDRSFLISFLPFLDSMSWGDYIELPGKINDIMQLNKT